MTTNYVFSKMTGKLEGLMSLSTSPLANPFCQKMNQNKSAICGSCYSVKMLSTFRKNINQRMVNNGNILSGSVIPENNIPVINQVYFRISAHGELINDIHLINVLNLANKNPQTTFSLWTKRRDIVNRVFKTHDKPENLILVYSEPMLDKVVNTLPNHFDKRFSVVSEMSDKVNCGAKKCMNCLLCYKKNTTSFIIEKVK